MSKPKVTRPLWLVVLAGQHGHAYITYIVLPLVGLGGPGAYNGVATNFGVEVGDRGEALRAESGAMGLLGRGQPAPPHELGGLRQPWPPKGFLVF